MCARVVAPVLLLQAAQPPLYSCSAFWCLTGRQPWVGPLVPAVPRSRQGRPAARSQTVHTSASICSMMPSGYGENSHACLCELCSSFRRWWRHSSCMSGSNGPQRMRMIVLQRVLMQPVPKLLEPDFHISMRIAVGHNLHLAYSIYCSRQVRCDKMHRLACCHAC